jgi:hypothetical protein
MKHDAEENEMKQKEYHNEIKYKLRLVVLLSLRAKHTLTEQQKTAAAAER